MSKAINRCIELLKLDQAIYYTGHHTGHVLTYAQGVVDSRTWADYINIGMEHGSFEVVGLAEYLRGLVDGGPTASGHRTPTVVVEAPVNGTDETNVRHNAWQFRQILGRGAHGIILCQAETPGAARAFGEACRYPIHLQGVDPAIPTPEARMHGASKNARTPGENFLGIGARGRGWRGRAVRARRGRELRGRREALAVEPHGRVELLVAKLAVARGQQLRRVAVLRLGRRRG